MNAENSKPTAPVLDGASANPPDRTTTPPDRPPFASLAVVCLYGVLTVSQFTVAIPTATRYIDALGGTQTLAGWVVGATAIATALMQPLISIPLKRYPLKKIMLVLCFVNALGAALYGLGDVGGNIATLLVARAIQGSVSGPTYMSTYVTRTTSTKLRSHYMQFIALAIGLGYGFGPFNGAALIGICNAANLDGKVFNAYTSPGWLWAFYFLAAAVAIGVFMIEPPRPDLRVHRQESTEPVPWTRVLCAWPIVFAVPLNIGSWDVHTALLGEQKFGWSLVSTALYLGGLNLIPVPTALLPVSQYLSDRRGSVIAFVSFLASTVFFWNYGLPTAPWATMYGIGSVLLLTSAIFAKSFSWALVSKQPPPEHRTYVMACNGGVYMMGRGVGAVVAGYLTPGNDFAFFLVGVDAATILYIVAMWRFLTVPDESSHPGVRRA